MDQTEDFRDEERAEHAARAARLKALQLTEEALNVQPTPSPHPLRPLVRRQRDWPFWAWVERGVARASPVPIGTTGQRAATRVLAATGNGLRYAAGLPRMVAERAPARGFALHDAWPSDPELCALRLRAPTIEDFASAQPQLWVLMGWKQLARRWKPKILRAGALPGAQALVRLRQARKTPRASYMLLGELEPVWFDLAAALSERWPPGRPSKNTPPADFSGPPRNPDNSDLD